jgi:ribose transport system permease protein
MLLQIIRKPFHLNYYQLVIAFFGLALIGILFLAPTMLSPDNIKLVLRQGSIPALMAIGVTFVVISGRLDLSVGSLLSLCAILIVDLHDKVGPIIAIGAGLGTGLLVGCVNGFLVAVLRLNPLIATLGMLSLLQGISLIYSDGRNALIMDPENTWFSFIGRSYTAGIPVPIIILIFATIIFSILLRYTTFGRKVYAIGGNEAASRYSGINAKRIVFSCYVISGLMTAVAAVVFSSRVMGAQNNSGSGLELYVLSGVILGGASLFGGSGTVLLSVVGVMILEFIQNGLLIVGLPYYTQWILTWIVIIAIVWSDLASKSYREHQ